MKFPLTHEQRKAADKWIDSQPKIDSGAIGRRWSYLFTPTSIGLLVVLIDNATKAKIDLTDYDSLFRLVRVANELNKVAR